MALVNVGLELVRGGRRVLLVDFDLEAPGLTTYKALRREGGHPGVVEYVTEYIRKKESPDVSRFLYPVDLARARGHRKARKPSNVPAEGGSRGSTGQLWVMPAGKGDAAYGAALGAINWNSLYEHLNGYLFFEDTKLQWREAVKPDYVLIDSRTGHTDVGGICTRQLADAVVLMFTPNEQNLAGLESVCHDIRREETEGLKKKIRLHFVASNVPDMDDENGLLHKRLRLFEDKLTIYREFSHHPRVVIHRHESLEMLEQPVFVQQRPRSRLAREYRRLVRRLIMENPVDRDGALYYLRGLERNPHLRLMWPVARVSTVMDRLDQIELQFGDDPVVLRHLAAWYQGLGELDLALRQYDAVLRLRPGWPDVLFERGRCRRQVQDKSGAAEDFLQYLRSPSTFRKLIHGIRRPLRAAASQDLGSPGFFPRDTMEADDGGHRQLEHPRMALQGLLDVSFEVFLQGLASPGARESGSIVSTAGARIWLDSAAEHLLREQRWEVAIQYLEGDVPELLSKLGAKNVREGEELLPYLQGKRVWYLAMARWGETGSLPTELCRTTLDLFQTALAKYRQHAAVDLQRMSLLHWRLGDAERASALLDCALEESAKAGVISNRERGVSNWTFREASAHEFRQHCEEQRRMIQGESIRPAFLGLS
jgi:tetratricopeptide (TPR) repeat protein